MKKIGCYKAANQEAADAQNYLGLWGTYSDSMKETQEHESHLLSTSHEESKIKETDWFEPDVNVNIWTKVVSKHTQEQQCIDI